MSNKFVSWKNANSDTKLQLKPTTVALDMIDQRACTPQRFCARHFFTRHLLHQTPFTPETMSTFCAKHLLNQTTLNHATFTADTLYTNQFLHQSTCTPSIFHTMSPFTPSTFYAKQLLTAGNFYTKHR